LPSARGYAAAIWTGQFVYLFGGRTNLPSGVPVVLDEIVRFDPATGSSAVFAHLPTGRYAATAVWTGQTAYVLGGDEPDGFGGDNVLNDIVSFVPATGAVTLLPSHLSTEVFGAASVFSGSTVYVLGGRGYGGTTNLVQTFVPGSGQVGALAVGLPGALFGAGSAFDGTNAFLFAGNDGQSSGEPNVATIVRFSPGNGSSLTMDVGLPYAEELAAAVWTGSGFLIAGGIDATKSTMAFASVFAYSALPSAPASLEVTTPHERGELVLSWAPPPANSYSVFAGYNIYRTLPSGQPKLIATVGPNVVSFVDTGLPDGANVFYRVFSLGLGAMEGGSIQQGACTWSLPSTPTQLTVLPGRGLGSLDLYWFGGRAACLFWPDSFSIYQGTSPSTLGLVATVPPEASPYPQSWVGDFTANVPGCSLGSTCYLSVQANDVVGSSATSEQTMAVGANPSGATPTVVPPPVAVQSSGNAEGGTFAVSVTGTAQQGAECEYTYATPIPPCESLAFVGGSGAQGGAIGVAATGPASTAPQCASTAFVANYYQPADRLGSTCAQAGALSGTGGAQGGFLDASATGPASGGGQFQLPVVATGPQGGLATTVSGTGPASGGMAGASATQSAAGGNLALSGTGNANASSGCSGGSCTGIAVLGPTATAAGSGVGSASSNGASVSGAGPATGGTLAVSGTNGATGNTNGQLGSDAPLVASGTGPASAGQVAATGLGPAQGDGIALSGTGPATASGQAGRCFDGWCQTGIAISGTGDAEGPIAVSGCDAPREFGIPGPGVCAG
jgi:hypothetical protein